MGKIKVKVNTSPNTFVVFLLMPLIGIGLILYGVFSIINIYNFKNNCSETMGVVVDVSYSLKDSDSDRKKYRYYAIYEYEVDGNFYTVKDNEYSLFKPELGDKEIIYYDVDEPSNAMVHIKESQGIIMTLVGVVITPFSCVLITARLKAKNNS